MTDRSNAYRVTIYLNQSTEENDGYRPEHVVRKVFSYEVPVRQYDMEDIITDAWDMFGLSPDPRDEWGRVTSARYLAGKHRPLDIRDVLRIEKLWLPDLPAVWVGGHPGRLSGWARLDTPPTIVEDKP